MLLIASGELEIVTDSTLERQGWREILARIACDCAGGGLDLTAALRVSSYNEAVADPRLCLPDFGRPASLAVVIGNTRRLWRPLLARLAEDQHLLQDPNPIETHTMRVVGAAVARLANAHEVRWSHTVGAKMVAMQRLAEDAGLAYLSPAKLSIHPRYGPWIALRAAVVVDVDGPPPSPPMAAPCDACEFACSRRFGEVIAMPPGERNWRQWLSLRDSCPLGLEYRYSEDQIEYHYTKDAAILARAVARRLIK